MAGAARARVRAAADAFAEQTEASRPAWVAQFVSPFVSKSPRAVVKEFLADGLVLVLMRWAEEHMSNSGGLENMVVPIIRYKGPDEPFLDYCLVLGDPDDALRLGRAHVSKDPTILPMPARNVVNTSDVTAWRAMRSDVVPAFLPKRHLAPLVPGAVTLSEALLGQWRRQGPLLDLRAWMHHVAMSMFIKLMLGEDRPYGSTPLAETSPVDSLEIREMFSLENLATMGAPEVAGPRLARIMAYTTMLHERARARRESGDDCGALMGRILEIEDVQDRVGNTAALLVAGHDTTAYTMQMLLFELARHPELQQRVREEADRVLAAIEAERRSITYDDLPRFEFLTKCIAETLRLWNVAPLTFGRVTDHEDVAKGLDGVPMTIPAGTKFTFWFHGHHHSPQLWGPDACSFNPDRAFVPSELLRQPGAACPVSAKTPCTERFHPFSVPARDCLGKNFSYLEMRLLIPRIVRAFRLSLPESKGQGGVAVSVDNTLFRAWVNRSTAPPQPAELWVQIEPVAAARL